MLGARARGSGKHHSAAWCNTAKYWELTYTACINKHPIDLQTQIAADGRIDAAVSLAAPMVWRPQM